MGTDLKSVPDGSRPRWFSSPLVILQQHVNGPGAAVDLPCRAVSQDFLPLLQPFADQAFNGRPALFRAQALTVDDAHATLVTVYTLFEKVGEAVFGILYSEIRADPVPRRWRIVPGAVS